MNVLVVDDNEDVRLVFRFLLGSEGITVNEAASGPEALESLTGGARPDVVVLDVQMPDLDGWDTLRALRDDPSIADTPVILCTVKGRPVDTVRGWEIGCDGYVDKPFDIEAILGEVRAVVGRNAEERVARRRAGLARARAELAEVERHQTVGR